MEGFDVLPSSLLLPKRRIRANSAYQAHCDEGPKRFVQCAIETTALEDLILRRAHNPTGVFFMTLPLAILPTASADALARGTYVRQYGTAFRQDETLDLEGVHGAAIGQDGSMILARNVGTRDNFTDFSAFKFNDDETLAWQWQVGVHA